MQYINEIKLNTNISEDSYLSQISFIKALQSGKKISLNQSVSFFVGENGMGKSTLLEAIALQLGYNAEGGSKNFNFNTVDATDTELSQCITVSKKAYPTDGYFLRAESFFNVATSVEQLGVSGYGEKSLHQQSHGESFAALFENRFRGNGLYILDEPEAALSPTRLLTILYYMDELVKANSQFIIATHSPILLAYPRAEIFELSEQGFDQVEYKDTELYQSYKNFLDQPEAVIRKLLKDEI